MSVSLYMKKAKLLSFTGLSGAQKIRKIIGGACLNVGLIPDDL
jgi:hypothetical protein